MYEATTDRQPVSAGYYRPAHDHRSRSFFFWAIGGGAGLFPNSMGRGWDFLDIVTLCGVLYNFVWLKPGFLQTFWSGMDILCFFPIPRLTSMSGELRYQMPHALTANACFIYGLNHGSFQKRFTFLPASLKSELVVSFWIFICSDPENHFWFDHERHLLSQKK